MDTSNIESGIPLRERGEEKGEAQPQFPLREPRGSQSLRCFLFVIIILLYILENLYITFIHTY